MSPNLSFGNATKEKKGSLRGQKIKKDALLNLSAGPLRSVWLDGDKTVDGGV